MELGEKNINAYSQTGIGALQGASQAIKASKQMPAHAEKLHYLSEQLTKCNAHLEVILDRITGPVPKSETPGQADQAQPAGFLMVAQFGAERIHRQINILGEQLNRLDNLV